MYAASSWDHTGAVIWCQLEVTRSGSSVLGFRLSIYKHHSTFKELTLFMKIASTVKLQTEQFHAAEAILEGTAPPEEPSFTSSCSGIVVLAHVFSALPLAP